MAGVWQVHPTEQRAADEALQQAFEQDTDDAWQEVLELTGAAEYDDDRGQSPLINVQHSNTGVDPPIYITWLWHTTQPSEATRVLTKARWAFAVFSCLTLSTSSSAASVIGADFTARYFRSYHQLPWCAGATALMYAAGQGRESDVSVLLSNGADVLLTSNDGRRASGWALRCCSSMCFSYNQDTVICC